MGQELEWKFAASPAALDAALVLPEIHAYRTEPVQTLSMRTSYYDTPDHALSEKRWTLRLRQENGVGVACCKTPLAGGARGEWEVPSDSLEAALPALVRAGAPEELLTLHGLVPVCGAEFVRHAAALRLPDRTLCELACDAGRLFGRAGTMPLCEIELEHKSGDPEASRALAAHIAQLLCLSPEPRSKAQRAFSLQ